MDLLEETILVGAAGWRITALMSYERGPFDIFLLFRKALGFQHNKGGEPTTWPDGGVQKMLSCPWCLGGLSVAFMFGLWQVSQEAVIVFAAWAALIGIERWNHG